ncbi:MAG: flagellar biosynthesis protein FlhF [Clostridiales bacterium]|nr:flagellar biosynthesis protein FlhF [Clostridiales bacterium]
MIIKKYQASNENDAIMKAMDDLGKDAIVMNVKTIRPRGISRLWKKTLVELTAAVDDNQTESVKEEIDTKRLEEAVKRAKEEVAERAKEQEENQQAEAENVLEQKMNNIQSLLEKQLESKMEYEQRSDAASSDDKTGKQKKSKEEACIELIRQKMIDNEVDGKYADQIIHEIGPVLKKDATVDKVLASVYQKIILKLGKPDYIDMEEGATRFVFFIGPTGVGKTTTIAKIASEFKLNRKAKIAMVTSDTYRIAAVEQLRTYANILGIPLKVIYSAEEMRDLVKEFAGFDIVFVDTAGRSHKNKEQWEDIRELLEVVPEEKRQVYLVLTATTKYRDLCRIADAYQELTKYSLIFTKLDETACLGNVLNLKMYTDAPLSYTTWGQNVPDDIGGINAQSIAKKLLGGND